MGPAYQEKIGQQIRVSEIWIKTRWQQAGRENFNFSAPQRLIHKKAVCMTRCLYDGTFSSSTEAEDCLYFV